MKLTEIIGYKGAEEILLSLLEEDSQTFGKLAARTKYRTTASRALRMLRKEKLIQRFVHQDELRSVCYTLTEKGRETAEIVAKLHAMEDSRK